MKPVELRDALYTKCPLRFGENGRFRVLMVSDVHGGVGYNEVQTVAAMQALVDETKPDLVLMGGDIAGPGMIHVENEAQLRHVLDGLTSPMEKAGIPWAHVYGNHDNNFGLENDQQQVIYETYPHCVSKAGPEDVSGSGNYVLPVWDHAGEKILFNVFGLDSHRGLSQFKQKYGLPEETTFIDPGLGRTNGVDTIHFNQIMWYWQTSEMLEEYNGAKIPAMMYMHIPLPEHQLVTLYKNRCRFEGNQGEDVACSPLNSGLFAACLQRGDVKGIFFGHDHENDFCGQYAGITLANDAFLSYHACHRNDLRGGRVIDVYADDPATLHTHMVRVRDILGEAGDSRR